MDVDMLDCLFEIDEQQEQEEAPEEERDTRNEYNSVTATNPLASHSETG